MKTVYAPDSLSAVLENARDVLAGFGPAAALFAAAVAAVVIAGAAVRSSR